MVEAAGARMQCARPARRTPRRGSLGTRAGEGAGRTAEWGRRCPAAAASGDRQPRGEDVAHGAGHAQRDRGQVPPARRPADPAALPPACLSHASSPAAHPTAAAWLQRSGRLPREAPCPRWLRRAPLAARDKADAAGAASSLERFSTV
jgi:hypothetical protein